MISTKFGFTGYAQQTIGFEDLYARGCMLFRGGKIGDLEERHNQICLLLPVCFWPSAAHYLSTKAICPFLFDL
jgi:hypothetical protein